MPRGIYQHKPHSEERKKKISNSLKGVNTWLKGRHLSIEHRNRISQSNKGKPTWNKGKVGVKTNNKGMTAWNKGKKTPEETRKKQSNVRKGRYIGEKCSFWKGGKMINYPEYERVRKSIEYILWRDAVFARDGWTCQNCGDNKGGNLNAHHTKPFIKYTELRMAIDNGITLCKECHKKEHKIYAKHKNN